MVNQRFLHRRHLKKIQKGHNSELDMKLFIIPWLILKWYTAKNTWMSSNLTWNLDTSSTSNSFQYGYHGDRKTQQTSSYNCNKWLQVHVAAKYTPIHVEKSQCIQWDSIFATPSSLLRHIRVKQRQLEIPCKPYDKDFVRRDEYSRHLRSSNPDKPH